MTRYFEIEIHLDGSRSIRKQLPDDWDTWSLGKKEEFVHNAKMDLMENSVGWVVLGLQDD